MPATDAAPPAPAEGEQVASLKRVKEVEAEWEAKVKRAHEEGEARLATLRTEVDDAVTRTREEAERAREAAVDAARKSAEVEAETILTAGRATAAAVGSRSADDSPGERDELLQVLLGEFRKSRSPEPR